MSCRLSKYALLKNTFVTALNEPQIHAAIAINMYPINFLDKHATSYEFCKKFSGIAKIRHFITCCYWFFTADIHSCQSTIFTNMVIIKRICGSTFTVI